MAVARQQWLDWESDPPGFSKYGCDDIGDLLASGQMSVEDLDYDLSPEEIEREKEQTIYEDDYKNTLKRLKATVIYSEKETDETHYMRISMMAVEEVSERARQREAQKRQEKEELIASGLDWL